MGSALCGSNSAQPSKQSQKMRGGGVEPSEGARFALSQRMVHGSLIYSSRWEREAHPLVPGGYGSSILG